MRDCGAVDAQVALDGRRLGDSGVEAEGGEPAERCTRSADLKDVAPGELGHHYSFSRTIRARKLGPWKSLCPDFRPSSLGSGRYSPRESERFLQRAARLRAQ